jgi:hypothetical protein
MSKLNNAETTTTAANSDGFLRFLIYISVALAIVLPCYVNDDNVLRDFFSSANQAKQVEGRNNIGAINRAQQAFYLDNNHLADSLTELGLGIKTETDIYHYRIIQPMMLVQDLNQSGSSDSDVLIRMAIADKNVKENIRHNDLKNYFGVVYTVPETSASGETEIITRAILCEMERENPLPTAIPTVNNGIVECPVGSKNLGE